MYIFAVNELSSGAKRLVHFTYIYFLPDMFTINMALQKSKKKWKYSYKIK